MKIHFLNVGHGDCCIIEFDSGRISVIDINRSNDVDESSFVEIVSELSSYNELTSKSFFESGTSLKHFGYDIDLQDPIEYIKDNNFGTIFRFISTHPHMDHLAGLKKLDEIGMYNFWVLNNNIEPDLEKLSESQKEDWNFYKSLRDSDETKISGITIVRASAGDSRNYWDEDKISILAPNDDLLNMCEKTGKANKMSYVLLIETNRRKILLGGDAEEETWKYLVENHENMLKDIDILKASHHGRNSGYYQPALKLMSPTHTIVSVGKKPSTDATNKYRHYSDNVYSTRWKGNITFEIDSLGNIAKETQYDR